MVEPQETFLTVSVSIRRLAPIPADTRGVAMSSAGLIFQELGFQVEVREDRVDARYYKYDEEAIQEKLDLVGRLLQFTRQMDMLMQSEASVQAIAQSFLDGNYSLDAEFWQGLTSHDR